MEYRQNIRVSVIGAGNCDDQTALTARRLGRLLPEAGFDLVCGGLGGVMLAACQGATEAGGLTIGILPGASRSEANAFVDVAISTGLGIMRNALVVANGDAAIAVAGGAGTLSEIAMALKTGKPVIALGTWSGLDGVVRAESPEEAVEMLGRFGIKSSRKQ